MLETNGILFKLEVFQYTASLDLDMGYYNIQITEYGSNLCTFFLPERKYHNKRLTMGVSNSP